MSKGELTRPQAAVVMSAPIMGTLGVFGSIYLFLEVLSWLPLVLSLLLTLMGVVGSGAISTKVGELALDRMGKPSRKKRNAELAKAEKEARKATYMMMSHLTPADERWLAERHHYVIPVEVARIRAGVEWDTSYADQARLPGNLSLPIPFKNRQDLVQKSKQARQLFEGAALHEPGQVNPTYSQEHQLVELPAQLLPRVQEVRDALQAAEDAKRALESKDAKPDKTKGKRMVADVLTGEVMSHPTKDRRERGNW